MKGRVLVRFSTGIACDATHDVCVWCVIVTSHVACRAMVRFGSRRCRTGTQYSSIERILYLCEKLSDIYNSRDLMFYSYTLYHMRNTCGL